MSSRRDSKGRHQEPADPETFFGDVHGGRGDRKVQQLCREVERTLGGALGECSDERVRNLVVVMVEPAPDASRLLVIVAPMDRGTSPDEMSEQLASVERAKGFLRQEIARVLQRKRTPELSFQLAPLPPAALGTSDDAPGDEEID